MTNIQNFVQWFLDHIPSFLMSEPIVYFVGLVIAGCLIRLIINIIGIERK